MNVRIWLGLFIVFVLLAAGRYLPGWKPFGWLDFASLPVCAFGCWLIVRGAHRGMRQRRARRTRVLGEIRTAMIERKQGKDAAAERAKGESK